MKNNELRLVKKTVKVGDKTYTHYYLKMGIVKVQIEPTFKEGFNFKLLQTIYANQEIENED